jgi:hypothetical protein
VPHLLMTQYHLLRTAEQLAAIPPENFTLELCNSEQVPLFAPWQIDQIRDNRLFIHRLMKNQVDLIHPDQVNNLTPKQIGWITKPDLLQRVKNTLVPHVNLDQVNQLTDQQLAYLQEEQIEKLSIDRLSLLKEEQLLCLSLEQFEKVIDPVVSDKLDLIKARISLIAPEELEMITKLFSAHMLYLSDSCLEGLSTSQVNQFKVDALNRLSDDKLRELSKKQLGMIDSSQTTLIQRLGGSQLFSLIDAALDKISAEQLQRISDQDLLGRISDAKLEGLSEEEVNKNTSVEFLKRLPASMMPKLYVSTVYWIPFETLQEIGIDKVRGCSFLQKLVLTVHYLVLGILKFIGELIYAFAISPIYFFGFPIDQEWNQVGLTLEGIGWSVTIWLPVA